MIRTSRDLWYLAVSTKDGPPPEAMTRKVLEARGCRCIELMDHGSAKCRIPMDWKQKVQRDKSFRQEVTFDKVAYRIDIDTP